MNNYLSPLNIIFSDIIKRYGFAVENYDDETVFLTRKHYQIEFIMWRETVEIKFCVIKENNEVTKYQVKNFIVTGMTDEDRVVDNVFIPPDESDVYKRNVKALSYFANALQNHFSSMLEGKMDWFAAYEKSAWFSPPVTEKRRV